MEQEWCGKNDGKIYNIICSKKLKLDVLKTDETQVNELGKYGGVYCRMKYECEQS